jgi:hypothetical protein
MDEAASAVLRDILDEDSLYSPEEQRRRDLQEMLGKHAGEISTDELTAASQRFHPDQYKLD